jgi:hypothetical protein
MLGITACGEESAAMLSFGTSVSVNTVYCRRVLLGLFSNESYICLVRAHFASPAAS